MAQTQTQTQTAPRFARMQAFAIALGLACTESAQMVTEYTYTVRDHAQEGLYIVLDSSQFTSPADIDPRYMTAYAQGYTFYIERIA
tara:strand:+ start:227 stop:484 length:258 start_codon:yes stop_codon:yes gene_type:complete